MMCGGVETFMYHAFLNMKLNMKWILEDPICLERFSSC